MEVKSIDMVESIADNHHIMFTQAAECNNSIVTLPNGNYLENNFSMEKIDWDKEE